MTQEEHHVVRNTPRELLAMLLANMIVHDGRWGPVLALCQNFARTHAR